MHIDVHTSPTIFDTLGGEWNALLARSASNTVFLTREWQRVWWRCLGDGDGQGKPAELAVLTLRDEQRLVGIAPLYFAREADGDLVGHFVGCREVSDYLDFIFERGMERACAERVVAWLAGDAAPAWRRLALCNVSERSPNTPLAVDLARARGWRAEVAFEDVCPIITLPGTFDNYLASLDGKERREMARKLRRASEDTRVVYTTDRSALPRDLDDFLRLMKASMFSKSDFMTPRMESFFRDMTGEMFDAGWLQLAFLEVEGDRAAAYLNFVYDNTVLVYNSGLDPARYSYLSPGQVLIARLIEGAITDGRRVFDFLQGSEDYKHKLGGLDTLVHIVHIAR